MLSLNAQL